MFAHDRVFKALSASVRRRISTICVTSRSPPERFARISRTSIAARQHLKVLEQADLVTVVRRGRERWNYLNPLPIHEIHERWIGPHAALAVERLGRLKATLESQG